jgi:hypothetical protein
MADGIITFVDGVAMLVTPDGREYRWSDVQRHNNPGVDFDDITGAPLLTLPTVGDRPAAPPQPSLGSRVGNEDIASGRALALDPAVSLYSALDPEGRYSNTLLGQINQAVMRVPDLALGGLLAGSGAVSKGAGYVSDALGLDLQPGDIPNAEEQGQLLDALYALPASRMLGAISEAGGRAAAARGIFDRLNQPGPVPTMGSNFGNLSTVSTPAMPRSFSQALKSVRELKQDKGSYDQFRAALIKAGVKPDELQWTGADSTFKGKKVTKDELEQFFLDASSSLGEDIRFGSRSGYAPFNSGPDALVDAYVERALPDEVAYYENEILPESLASNYGQVADLDADDLQRLADNTGLSLEELERRRDYWVTDDLTDAMDEGTAIQYFFGDPTELAEQSLRDTGYYEASRDPVQFAQERLGLSEDDLYSNVEYAEYFPKGGQNYAERLYTYTDPTDRIDYNRLPGQSHFSEQPDEGALLGWARTAGFPVEGGGTAYYIGEAQSDAGQTLRKRMRTTGFPARDYDQTLGAAEYEAAVRPASRAAMSAYYELADAWNRLPNEARASELTRLQLQDFNDYLARQSDDFVSIDNLDDISEEGYDAFNAWREGPGWRLPGATVINPDTAAILARGYGTGYSGQPEFDAALDVYRSAQPALNETRETQLGLLGFDPAQTLANAPFLSSTQAFTDFVLRRNLEDAIRSRANYLAIPYQEQAIGAVGGASRPTEGSLEYYRGIMPKRLEKLAQRYDKAARLEPITMLGEAENPRIPAAGLRLTPEFIEEVRKRGIPLWALGGLGFFGSGLLGSQEQASQPSSGLLGGI